MKILVTGGAGYIGSFTVRKLIESGHNPVVFDLLENGHAEALPKGVTLIKGDLRSKSDIESLLSKNSFDVVIHFAGYIESGESMRDPLKFFEDNFSAGINLLQGLNRYQVHKLIFSSTAGVYGNGNPPYKEDSPLNLTSYYSMSKRFFEEALKSWTQSYNSQVVVLRYFNAAGGALDGTNGEFHQPETHLIPNVIRTALGMSEKVSVFGTDWETPDGTGVRDYIHVEDLARAHIAALRKFEGSEFGYTIYNVGIGRGYSVREVIDAVKLVSGVNFKVDYLPRRAGDWASSYADCKKIKEELGWQAEYSLKEIVNTAYLWHKTHPKGFSNG